MTTTRANANLFHELITAYNALHPKLVSLYAVVQNDMEVDGSIDDFVTAFRLVQEKTTTDVVEFLELVDDWGDRVERHLRKTCRTEEGK